MLIFDTSIIIDIEHNIKPTIEKIKELSQTYPFLPKIAFIAEFEFIYGLQGKNEKNQAKALSFLQNFEVVYPTKKTSSIIAQLKYKYERKGLTFSLTDLYIAALALEHQLILITKDGDFKPIEEINKIVLE